MQADYMSMNNFTVGRKMVDSQPQAQPQQQIPVSPPQFNSPLVSGSSGSSVESDTLRYKSDMCKSFEDDLFYCPRSLLSAQEQITCERMDMFLAEQFREYQLQTQITLNARPKFNPYTSESFNPGTHGQ
ncbi:hypothetical protein ZYGR_0AN00460 [Zygosaccharomyces rouxii]|uniref:Uncharacterized protein n=1 Tax=Zygosaccharomyces rouxii TaxID=4956 RepID=A0A1Q3AFV2_ZYGRO|nr:hypothetical protein ZYGR_0AN00460 [Zygosaccharomyces rouxii]